MLLLERQLGPMSWKTTIVVSSLAQLQRDRILDKVTLSPLLSTFASACYAEHFIQVVREHKVLNPMSQ